MIWVAQMLFASELPLSQGYHSMHMDSQEMIIQANPGSTRKKMGKLLSKFPLTGLEEGLRMPMQVAFSAARRVED